MDWEDARNGWDPGRLSPQAILNGGLSYQHQNLKFKQAWLEMASWL